MKPLDWKVAVLFGLIAAVSFNLAYLNRESSLLRIWILSYVFGLFQLIRLATKRQSFYAGLLTGLCCIAPQLGFFWRIFGPGATALWLVLAFWIGLFVMLGHIAVNRFGTRGLWFLPFLWTGLEYFRSELYFLKFSWLNVGYAFAGGNGIAIHSLGVYGIGFVIAVCAALTFMRRKAMLLCLLPFPFFYYCLTIPISVAEAGKQKIRIAGVQLEFPMENQIVAALNKLISVHTNADLVVLSEYTLDGPVPDSLKKWCRDNARYLVVGGKDPATNGNFFNTAFVISPSGEIVFKQVKRVPIQFFKDGLPAPQQAVWDSPWGKIGFCICYDLSYSRVTDELIRQGAQLLIVPTMDVTDWGAHEHWLHALIAPMRAAEYRVPIFRLASSGISQAVRGNGTLAATTPFPGEGEMLFFETALIPEGHGSPPLDRYLAPLCVGITGGFILWMTALRLRKSQKINA